MSRAPIALLVSLLALAVIAPWRAAWAQAEVVVPVPYSQKNPDIPHPVHKGARTTLKAYVRDASCGTYTVCWDVNRNGNYDDDWCRDVGPDGNSTLWEIGRTYEVPRTDLQGRPLTADTTLNISVRVRNQCNGALKYGTYRMFVYNWEPSNDPRQWTAEQLEILQVEAVDEGMWFNHRTVVNRGGRNTNNITGQCPFTEGTGLYLWLYNINGHLPAYPPGTYNAFGQNDIPNGFIEENNRRWAVDPYAETAVRLMNDLTAGANLTGVAGIDEDTTCGFNAQNQEVRCNRIAGTADGRGAYSSRGAGTYQMGINGGAVATCLPSMAGTRIQNGPLAGNRFEWFAQQMTDLLGWMQLDGGAAYGSWYYHNVDLPNETPPGLTSPCYGTTCGAWAVYSDMSTTQWALVGMDGIQEAGESYGIVINNRHKYRVAEQLKIAQRADSGGVTYANNYNTPDMKLTGGAILGARWLGLHAFNPNDGAVTRRPYTQFSNGELRQMYDRYVAFAAEWWAQRRVHGTHWLDGLWQYGDYLCGDADGIYSQPRCGNTYGIYSHQKGYRTNAPLPATVGGHDWNREFSTYYIRAMFRDFNPGDPMAGYGNFGQIVDDYCEIWGVTCGYGPGYFGSVMGHLVLTPTLFHPKPVPLAKVDQTEVFAGCAGGTNGKVIFDHSESFHPNFAARIVRYEWDVDAANGLWWETGANPDYRTPGPDGVAGQIFEYTYNSPGLYRATLRVIDDAAETKTSFVEVRVLANPNTPPGAVAGAPYVQEEGEALQLAGNAFDANVACGDVITTSWDFNNDGTFGDAGITRADALVPWASLQGLPRGVPNRIRLKVRDAAGLEAIAETTLTIWNSTPQAVMRINPIQARCNEAVLFDGSRSGSPNPLRQIVRYDWNVDGRAGDDGLGPVFQFTYPLYGTYPVTLRVTDDRGRTATANGQVEVNQGNTPPVARIAQPLYTVLSGEALTLDGSASSDPNAGCGDRVVTYRWDVNGNGVFGEAGIDVDGPNVRLEWAVLQQRLRWPASRETNQPANTLRLQVVDTFGATHTAETTVVIYDATPVPDFEQTPNPAPINLRTGEVRPFLDARASRSPIPGVTIARVDWDIDDNGTFEVENRASLEAVRVINPIPRAQNQVPPLFVSLRITDSTGRTATRRAPIAAHIPPTPPTADADPSDIPETGYHILVGESLTLNGAASFDPDAADFGDFVTFYRWDINWVEGVAFRADISQEDQNADAAEARVTLTPQQLAGYGMAAAGNYLVRLQVEDTTGDRNEDSAPVVVHPVDPNARFTADTDHIACGERVTLDARASYHPHPRIRITGYDWDFDNDGQFDDAEGAVVQARYDQFTFGVPRTIRLRVTDSMGHTATAQTQVHVDRGNRPPLPVAGGNRDVGGNVIGPYVRMRGETLPLSGTGTSDPDAACGDAVVRYQWDVKNDGSYEFDRADASVPVISAAQLTAWNMQALGNYEIRLRATDRFGATADQVVPFRVVNGPTAIATASPARVACNAQVTFDASASFTDGPVGQGFDLVEFLWDLDNDGQFDDASGARTSRNAFALPDAQGNVTMTPRVRVRDISGRTAIASAVVVINPQNLAPIAAAGGPYTTGPVNGGYQAITLDGRASYDPDEPCDGLLSYKWDIDADGLFGAEDNPAEPTGALVQNFISPLWQPNTTQTIRLKVCDMRNTCSKIDEADVQIRPAAPPLGRMVSPLAADGACIGTGNLDVRFEVSDPGGRPVTATVNIAGLDVGTANFNPPANGNMIPGSIRINPQQANIPEGRHLIKVIFRNNAGGISQVDAGDRLVFDRTAPTLTVGNQLFANACYAPAGVPRPSIEVSDFWDPVPTVLTETVTNVCARTFRATARDACANQTVVERPYFVAEAVPVDIQAPVEGALVADARVNWTVGGPDACHPLVSATLGRDGLPPQVYAANTLINQPGGYVFGLSVNDCLGQTRSYGRRFQINAPPVAVPVSFGHPQADPARANTYRVFQGDNLVVDASDSRAPEAFDRIVSYAWDWTADGTTDANTRTATYPTQTQGSFDGRLTVTDALNASAQSPFRVVVDDVNPICVAGGPYVVFARSSFTADASGSRPGTATEPITGYTWSWDDGTPDATGLRADHVYPEAGNYFLRLTCTDRDSTSSNTVRVDVRGLSPIITRFTMPPIVYEVVPQQYTVEAIASSENDPITSYEWDFSDDLAASFVDGSLLANRAEYRAPDATSIVHQLREPGRIPLAVRVYDTDTRGIRKYWLDVQEAPFTVLLEHLQVKIAAAVANPAYTAQQKLSLLDAQTYIDRALWGERYEQRGVALLAMDTLTTKMVQAQGRGIVFGTELWAFARQAWRELSRMETAMLARPGVDVRDPELVRAHSAIELINQWSQPAFEARLRDPLQATAAADNWRKVLEAYEAMRRYDFALKPCNALALKNVVDPVERRAQWDAVKTRLAAGLEGWRLDLQAYVDAGMRDNRPGPQRALVQTALTAMTEVAAIGRDTIGRVCGGGQTCTSEAKELRYISLLQSVETTVAQLVGSGVYTKLWEGQSQMARQCRYDLSLTETLDINANGNFLGSFPRREADRFTFDVIGDSEQVVLETSDGRGGCPAGMNTRLTLASITNGVRSVLASNDNMTAVRLCSRLDRNISRGRYEVVVDRADGLQGVDPYTLTVTHIRTDGCGDRRVAAGEECDDGNLDNGDGCGASCRIEATPIDAGGDFAGGFEAGTFDRYSFTLQARRAVQLAVTDGRGGCPGDARMFVKRVSGAALPVLVGSDDDSGPGACPALRLELDPGSYEVEVDGANGAAVAAYVLTATFLGACGDGTVDPGEGCDDRNVNPNDGCSAVCTLEAACGNARVDAGETCDDGNRANGDACDQNCRVEPGPVCGDGRVNVGEGCDDGNRLNGDGCSSECVREIRCGDRRVDQGEACDDGNRLPGDGCTADCQIELPCGNTRVDAGEECDDGDRDAGDGCDGQCRIEATPIVVSQIRLPGAVQARGANWYSFKADTTSNLYAETSDGRGGCIYDTIVTLFRKSGASNVQAGRDDDAGVELCSRLSLRIAAGDYLLRVETRNGVAMPQYTLDYRLDVTTTTAGSYVGAFAAGGDDMYTFTTGALSHVRMETGDGAGGCPGDTRLVLRRRNADGTRPELATNDDANGRPCSLIAMDLPGGSYEVVAAGNAALAAYRFIIAYGQPVGSCGNARLDAGEECDDGARVTGDGCDGQCRFECGNRRLDRNETCDDGNRNAGDGCSDTCRNEGTCGNGQTEPGEACDDGNVVGGDGCEANCSLRARCGDRTLNAGESCDDGNLVNGDGCDVLCTTEVVTVDKALAKLVNGVPAGRKDVFRFRTEDETIARLQTTDGAGGCPGNTVITLFRIGGDGSRTEIGRDDDGGVNGCSLLTRNVGPGTYELDVSAPAATPILSYTLDVHLGVDVTRGGGYSGGFEKSGNDLFLVNLAQASRIVFETSDGNGGCPGDTVVSVYRPGEAAVLGQNDNARAGTLCSRLIWPAEGQPLAQPGNYEIVVNGRNGVLVRSYAAAVSFARCGDQVVNAGEQCDDGNNNNGDGCNSTCQLENLCGNGRVDAGEQCDDGNRGNGDGCSADCRNEQLCGNGRVDPGEGCDDGNQVNGDGCSTQCQPDGAVCGNGRVEGAETCDDGNRNAGDGCSANCTVESNCGNGRVEAPEQCDDGNQANGDGCTSQCTREGIQIIRGTHSHSSQLSAGAQDVLRFTVENRSTVTLETKTAPAQCAGIDTEILLYSINDAGVRNLLTSNDDARAGWTCSLITRQVNVGNYEIVVRGKNGAAVAGYILDYRAATSVATAANYAGGFPAGGSDLFELRTAQSTRYTMTTSDGAAGCPGDTVFTFYRVEVNGARTNITPAGADDNGPGLCSEIRSFQTVANVTYEVVVSGKNDAAIPLYTFTSAIR